MARHRVGSSGPVVGLCAAMLILASAISVGAQSVSSSNSAGVQAPPSPEFMFGRPRASIGMRGNWLMSRAGSDVFDFVTEQLTLDHSSFNAPTVGAELGINVASRVDVIFGIDWAHTSQPSEYRKFIDNKGLPIQQSTTYRQMNLTSSVKFALLPKGRRVSRFAWVPNTITPYVGAGGGLVDYTLEQTGDFVDFKDNHVFTDVFSSNGWTGSAHVLGGTDIQIHRHLYMSLEGRYMWASAPLEQKFVGFDPIDLAGFRIGGGIHVVF